jgi:hypothetical protein
MARKKLGASPELRLQSKGTDDLNKSVASDMNLPDRPLSMEELQKLNAKGSQAITWVSQNETNQLDESTDAEIDAVDNEVD